MSVSHGHPHNANKGGVKTQKSQLNSRRFCVPTYLDDEHEDAFPDVDEAEDEDMSFSLEATAEAVCCCCCWRWAALFAPPPPPAEEAADDSAFLLRPRSRDLREPTSLVAGDIDMAEAGLTEGDTAAPTTRSESWT